MSGVLILLSKARDGWLSHLYLQEFGLQFKHPNKNPHYITAILSLRLGVPIALSSCTHPRIASHIPTCASPHTAWWMESWAKADGGDAFVPLHLLLLLLWEAAEAEEHPAGNCRRETWEYSCQTVATGAPERLPTQELICHLHSSEVWRAQISQLYSYRCFLPKESK